MKLFSYIMSMLLLHGILLSLWPKEIPLEIHYIIWSSMTLICSVYLMLSKEKTLSVKAIAAPIIVSYAWLEVVVKLGLLVDVPVDISLGLAGLCLLLILRVKGLPNIALTWSLFGYVVVKLSNWLGLWVLSYTGEFGVLTYFSGLSLALSMLLFYRLLRRHA